MRDIRNDLKERLGVIQSERQQLQARLEKLLSVESGLQGLLAEEDQRWCEQQGLFPEKGSQPESDLSKFLLRMLKGREQVTLGQLKEEAAKAGIDFGEKKPGRVMHFALLSLQQNGYVEMLADGVWRAKQSVS